MSKIIVFGNEKGGTGKSTIAIHVTTYLLHKNKKVVTIDIDARQGTFSRYIEKRAAQKLTVPQHNAIHSSQHNHRDKAEEEDRDVFEKILEKYKNADYIIIDTPGNNTYLSCLAHSYADKLVTPINDSFIDIDMLVRISSREDKPVIGPSTYSAMVWEQRKNKAKRGGKPIDWIVVRNRIGCIFSKNKEEIERVLKALAKRIGFRLITGFCERVIFRELYIDGKTVLDASENKNISHVAAKQELKCLIESLEL